MNVREEDRNKNCPSRGLGLAAAAIGVGVGAALYYFFSKRPENPAEDGATSSGWNCEQPHVLQHNDSSSYTTISEHSTSDISMDTSDSEEHDWLRGGNFNIMQTISRQLWSGDRSTDDISTDDSDSSASDVSDEEGFSEEYSISDHGNVESSNIESDSDTNMDWDVTVSSLDVPMDERRYISPTIMQFGELTVRLLDPRSENWKSPWKIFPNYFRSAGEQMSMKRDQAFRERSWSLEECSICFEVMLKDQDVLALSCTHRFHQACIMPWLQEQQTCPNCRKTSE